MRHLGVVRVGLLFTLAAGWSVGCGADNRGPGGTGAGDAGGPPSDGGVANPDGPIGNVDAGTLDNFNPFDPDAACGAALIPSQRVPGSLLFVYDRSASMEEDPRGNDFGSDQYMGPSKWETARSEVNGVLGRTGDELSTGMLLFPPAGGGDDCSVNLGASVPQVPIGELATTRSAIGAQLNESPAGANTPIIEALRAGYAHLDTLTTPGQRGLVLVTDGAENCRQDERDAMVTEVAMQHSAKGYQTYAIALGIQHGFLSRIAEAGGTARNDTCTGQCIASQPFCMSDADCPSSQSCSGLGGFMICMGPTDCCNYSASEENFQADFAAAIDDIARRFLDSCVFEVPETSGTFDPTLDGHLRPCVNHLGPWLNHFIGLDGPFCSLDVQSPSLEFMDPLIVNYG